MQLSKLSGMCRYLGERAERVFLALAKGFLGEHFDKATIIFEYYDKILPNNYVASMLIALNGKTKLYLFDLGEFTDEGLSSLYDYMKLWLGRMIGELVSESGIEQLNTAKSG